MFGEVNRPLGRWITMVGFCSSRCSRFHAGVASLSWIAASSSIQRQWYLTCWLRIWPTWWTQLPARHLVPWQISTESLFMIYFGSSKKHLGAPFPFFVHPQFRWRAGHVQGWMYNCSLLQFLEQFEISVSRRWVGPPTSSSSIQQDSSLSYELISLWSESSVLCCFFLAFFCGSERVKTPRCNPSPSSSEVRNSEKAQPTSKRVEKIIHFLTYQADGAYGAQIFTSQMVTGKIIWVTTAAGRKSLDLSAVFMRKIASWQGFSTALHPWPHFGSPLRISLWMDSGHTVGRRSTISGQYQYHILFFCSSGGSNMFKHMFEHVYPILSAPLFGPPPCETAVNITWCGEWAPMTFLIRWT